MGQERGRDRAGRAASGQTLVEFAFTSLILLALILGIIDLGRGVFQRAMLSNAVREAGRYGSISPADSGGIVGAAQRRAPTLGLSAAAFSDSTIYDGISCTGLTTQNGSWAAKACSAAGPRDRLSVCAHYRLELLAPRIVGFNEINMRECARFGVQ